MANQVITRPQVLLAMVRNLSIGTRCIKDSEGEKRAKNSLKMHKKCYNLHTSRELVSPICLSPSCLQADWCLQWTPSNSEKHLSCQKLQINLSAIFSSQLSWNSLWPLRIMIYFIWATFQKFLDGRSGLFHHHKFSNCRQGSPRSSNWKHDITFCSLAHDLFIFCFKTPDKLLGCL